MGNSTSSSVAPKSQEQEDVIYLGDRCPFGDGEILELYRTYQQFLQQQQTSSNDFLIDWCKAAATASAESASASATGTATTTDGRSSQKPEQATSTTRLQTVLREPNLLLPPDFGNALYRAGFAASGDDVHHPYKIVSNKKNEMDQAAEAAATMTATTTTTNTTDEYTRKARLEQFFVHGLSKVSGRRGGAAALELLFKALLLLSQKYNSQPITGADEDDVVSALQEPENRAEEVVSALQFVTWGYQIAQAIAYITNSSSDHKEDEHSPPSNIQSDTAAASSSSDSSSTRIMLQAMANSLFEKAKLRKERSGGLYNNDNEKPDANDNDYVEWNDVVDWLESVAPMFGLLLPTLFHFVLFPNKSLEQRQRTSFQIPLLHPTNCLTSFFHPPNNRNDTKQPSDSYLHPQLFTMACLSTPLATSPWHRLFTSADDGLSFNRLLNCLLGYDGPTLLLIRSAEDHDNVFGAYTNTSWKESKDFFGTTDCFLFQLQPHLRVYRPTMMSSTRNRRSTNKKKGDDDDDPGTDHYVYCNSAARSRGYDQQAHGIGFGGTVHEPRLFLSETFDDCTANTRDLTFENGRLLSDTSTTHFTLDSLEVWGVGGLDAIAAALEARDASRAITNEAIRRARKVDKAQFLDDFRSGVVSSKAFQHRQQVDGRAGDLDDRNVDKDKNYEYAK